MKEKEIFMVYTDDIYLEGYKKNYGRSIGYILSKI